MRKEFRTAKSKFLIIKEKLAEGVREKSRAI